MNRARLFLLALVLWAAWHAWNTRTISHPAGILAAEPPEQAATDAIPLRHGDFTLSPRASFAITARVLARERYRAGGTADLSPLDLALGWGPMSDSAVLAHIDISQGQRFYFWRTEAPPIPLNEIARHSANMHMVPANNRVRGKLLDLHVGDLVRIEGRLIDVAGPGGWHWRTSLTREDTGAGACEIVLVDYLAVRQK